MGLPGARQSANYGRGTATLDLEGLEVLDHSEVLARLESVFESPSYRPPRLPDAALKLLALSKKSNVDLRQIQRVLEEDQLLAAEVLRVAQSSAYAGTARNPVRTLEEALLRLGLSRVTDLFLHASLNLRVFRVKAYQKHMDTLRQHSLLVAHVARQLSRRTALYDEHSFLCGLLHDVGIAAALIAIAENAGRGAPPAFELIWPAVREVHARAGATLARIWQLPPEVGLVIRHHHEFEIQGYAHPTATVVALADLVATELGVGEPEVGPALISRALGGLGLAQADFEAATAEGQAFLKAQAGNPG
jgi:putative nucleotidyltransferase with HDIG domain